MVVGVLLSSGSQCGQLGLTEWEGSPISAATLLYPQAAVAPMGWSWGLHLVQAAHEEIVRGVLSASGAVQAYDHRPAPRVDETGVFSIYVDNIVVESTSSSRTAELIAMARQALEDAGLRCHPADSVSSDMEALGGRRTGQPPTSRLTRKRYWRLYDGITFLVDVMQKATSRQMEVLIGHLTFAGLFRRELVSSAGLLRLRPEGLRGGRAAVGLSGARAQDLQGHLDPAGEEYGPSVVV